MVELCETDGFTKSFSLRQWNILHHSYLFIYLFPHWQKKKFPVNVHLPPRMTSCFRDPCTFIRWRRGAKLNELRVLVVRWRTEFSLRCCSSSRRSGGRAGVLSNIKAAVRGKRVGKTGHFVCIVKNKTFAWCKTGRQAGDFLLVSGAEPLVGAAGTCNTSSGGKQQQRQKNTWFQPPGGGDEWEAPPAGGGSCFSSIYFFT